ncbi:MAG: hypothetical protein E3J86_14745 [Candidatus Thorarchaeota archaeon]|nr:MAG: hypothetical protein E3J86_14745 [Candidatus Thorarchaeota archaeon]
MAEEGETKSELLSIRFEKALEKKHPFTLLGVLIAIGFALFFIWGVHEGSWVEDLKEDGTVMIRDAKGSYQDEDPQSLGETRTIQL